MAVPIGLAGLMLGVAASTGGANAMGDKSSSPSVSLAAPRANSARRNDR